MGQQNSYRWTMLIADSFIPCCCCMSIYEQSIEPQTSTWQYLVMAPEPNEAITFQVPGTEIHKVEGKFWTHWVNFLTVLFQNRESSGPIQPLRMKPLPPLLINTLLSLPLVPQSLLPSPLEGLLPPSQGICPCGEVNPRLLPFSPLASEIHLPTPSGKA